MAFEGKLLSGVTMFMAVVEARTIARAAEALGLSPSGVSRALSRLEHRVGARLLARTTRSLSLTDEGRRFYEQVEPHLAGIEEGRYRGRRFCQQSTRTIARQYRSILFQNRFIPASSCIPRALS